MHNIDTIVRAMKFAYRNSWRSGKWNIFSAFIMGLEVYKN